MKRRILCFILAIILLLLFTGCSEKNISENTEEMEIGKVENAVFEIDTKYCTLKYPEKWKDSVTVEVAEPVVSFIHTETKTKVFDIVFGEGEGYLLGVIDSENEKIEVRVLEHSLNTSDAQIDVFFAMMDDVNVILNHLSCDYDFEVGSNG